jgi:hypothetical protein
VVADPLFPVQGRPGLLREEEVGGVIAVQVPDLPPAELEANSPRLPGPAVTPGQEVTTSVILSLADCVVVAIVTSFSGTESQATSSSELEVKRDP